MPQQSKIDYYLTKLIDKFDNLQMSEINQLNQLNPNLTEQSQHSQPTQQTQNQEIIYDNDGNVIAILDV